MAEQMPPIRQLVMVQQQYIMYNKEPADRPPPPPDQHSFFPPPPPVFPLPFNQSQLCLFPAAPRSRNESPASVTILKVSYYPSPLSLMETYLFEQKTPPTPHTAHHHRPPDIHPASFPFLLLHSCLISSPQWTRLFCFCNSQFDFFSPIEVLINFSCERRLPYITGIRGFAQAPKDLTPLQNPNKESLG